MPRRGAQAAAAGLFVWLQYLLPQHALSRLVLRATRVRAPLVQEPADPRLSQALSAST